MPKSKAKNRKRAAAVAGAATCSATVGGWWVFRLDKHDHAKIGDYWAGPFLNKHQADAWMKKQTWPNQLIVGRPSIICDADGFGIRRMKTNPKKLAEAQKLLRELRDWTQIENGLERENVRAAQVWREVNEWSRGAAMHLGLDLNLPVSQPPTSPSEVGGRGKRVICAAAKPGSITNEKNHA